MQAIESAAGGGNKYVNMLWLLLRMRQACNHPWLVKGVQQKSAALAKVGAAALAAARKLAPEQRKSLLSVLESGASECAQCGDVPENAVIAACHHTFCTQCISVQVRG